MFTACGKMHQPSCLLVTRSFSSTRFGRQFRPSSATLDCVPEDGRNYRPKSVELIEITNKLLLLHLVGCLYYCIRDARSHKHQTRDDNQALRALHSPFLHAHQILNEIFTRHFSFHQWQRLPDLL